MHETSVTNNPMGKGVIFDFNGTLFEDSALHERAWRSVARGHFDKTISQTEFQTFVHGRRNSSVLDYLSGGSLNGNEKKDLTEIKESMYRRFCLDSSDELRLAPGAEKLLDELAELDIPRSIATSSGKANMDFYIEIFDLHRWFSSDTIIFDRGDIPSKPAPKIFFLATEAMHLHPKRCIVFEDSTSGIEAARSAGIGTIIRLNVSGSGLADSEAHLTLRDFNEFDRRLLFEGNR